MTNETKIKDLDDGGAAAVNDYFVGERVAGTTKRFTYAPKLNMDTTPGLAGNLTLNGFAVGGATATEIGYLSGVTSAIQTQINTKVTSGGALGTPSSGNLSNCTNYPLAQLTGAGTGILTALANNVGSAGAPVLFNGALGTPSSGNVSSCSANTTPTASVSVGYDANKNIISNAYIPLRTSTATSAGTTTLTVASTQEQEFTGSTTHTMKLPVVSTLQLGQCYIAFNRSSGVVTVQSSGANTLQAMATNTMLVARCISLSGTGTASWTWFYLPVEVSLTGTGAPVLATSPTITTPIINGFTDGSNAAAGVVGQTLFTSTTSTSITSNIITAITSLSVPAGDWNLYGGYYALNSGGSFTVASANIYTTSATIPVPTTQATSGMGAFAGTCTQFGQALPTQTISISSPTTYYFNVLLTYTGAIASFWAFIGLRRTR